MADWLARAHAELSDKPAPLGRQDSPAIGATVYRLDYTKGDLAEFDALIDRYCSLIQRPDKRDPMLAARKRMRPATIAAELAEFRALVAATPTTKDDDYGR